MIESLIMWISAGVLAIALVLGSVFFAVKVVLPYYQQGAADTKHSMNITPAPKCEKCNLISMYQTTDCKQATKLKRGSLFFLGCSSSNVFFLGGGGRFVIRICSLLLI